MSGNHATLLFDHSIRCKDLFAKLLNILQDDRSDIDSQPLSVNIVEDELGRFRVWAGNIGALQRGPGSLDYRLREARSARAGFSQLLENLAETLEELLPLFPENPEVGQRLLGHSEDNILVEGGASDVATDPINSSESVSVDMGSELPGFAVTELWSSAKSTLTDLFRMSIVVRMRKRARFSKWETVGDFDPGFDIQHARHKFPFTAQNAEWLIERVGRANTCRRQYFRYRQNHRDKLAHESKPLPEDGASSIAPSSFQKTVASSIEKGEGFHYEHEVASNVARSDTSYACSVSASGSESAIRVPHPPPECGQGPFECPFCFEIQEVAANNSSRAWKKHVFSDLEPYVCTVNGCEAKPFQSRHEWFDHEAEQHRSVWICLVCSKEFGDRDCTLKKHIQIEHPVDVENDHLESVIRNCLQKLRPILNTDCPFCNDWKCLDGVKIVVKVSPKVFQDHVGNHMEQLALFALPRLDEPEEEVGLDTVPDAGIMKKGDDSDTQSSHGSEGPQDSGPDDQKILPVAAHWQIPLRVPTNSPFSGTYEGEVALCEEYQEGSDKKRFRCLFPDCNETMRRRIDILRHFYEKHQDTFLYNCADDPVVWERIEYSGPGCSRQEGGCGKVFKRKEHYKRHLYRCRKSPKESGKRKEPNASENGTTLAIEMGGHLKATTG